MTDFSLPACLSDDGDGSSYAMDFVCLCLSLCIIDVLWLNA